MSQTFDERLREILYDNVGEPKTAITAIKEAIAERIGEDELVERTVNCEKCIIKISNFTKAEIRKSLGLGEI